MSITLDLGLFSDSYLFQASVKALIELSVSFDKKSAFPMFLKATKAAERELVSV